MDDSSCDLGLRTFLAEGPFPPVLADWLAERKKKRQYMSHSFKPAGGRVEIRNNCFKELEEIPMYLLSLRNRSGRVLSYVGYNVLPIKGKRILVLEYLCTEETHDERHLNRFLLSLLMAWAAHDVTVRGVIAESINAQSGRMLARYFGMAKVTMEEVLDAESLGGELRPTEKDLVRWAYCCRDSATPSWKHLWQTYRRIQVQWRDPLQELPFFNTHINLGAPGVRVWLQHLLAAPPRA